MTLLFTCVTPFGIAAQPGTNVSPWRFSTEGYDLYAESEASLASARPGADRALEHFRRYFGQGTPRIAIFILDGVGAPPAVPDGMPMLTWFSPQGLAHARSHPGQPAIASDTVRDREFVEAALPHEICHRLLKAHLGVGTGAVGPAVKVGGHGWIGSVPPWFNEGVAVLCEPEDWKARRRVRIAEHGSPPPLTDLIAMAHPLGEARHGLQPEDHARARLFYAQSFSLLEFLAETEGPEFIGVVGTALARGEPLSSALVTAMRVPQDLTALDAAWREWLSPSQRRALNPAPSATKNAPAGECQPGASHALPSLQKAVRLGARPQLVVDVANQLRARPLAQGLSTRTVADEGMLRPSPRPAPNCRERASAAVLANVEELQSRAKAKAAVRNA